MIPSEADRIPGKRLGWSAHNAGLSLPRRKKSVWTRRDLLFYYCAKRKNILMDRVALMGLGTIGRGMGGQILKAGFPLTVYNRTPERASELLKRGARLASSPKQAAKNADIIIAMVSDDGASRQVWLGEQGALSAAKPGAIAIECSTISPVWVRELAATAQEKGCHFLDAPVTGSKVHAGSGELLFLVGGDAAILECARHVLKVMSPNTIHLGPCGSGALIKLINNCVCGIQAASLAEALALIERSGLNRENALEILTDGAPGSPLLKIISSRMTTEEYAVNFALPLIQKDLSYAIEEARTHDLSFRTGAAASEWFAKAQERGWGERNFSSVVEGIR
jgi:3-hydroxyisobutyrate dehydrogenase